MPHPILPLMWVFLQQHEIFYNAQQLLPKQAKGLFSSLEPLICQWDSHSLKEFIGIQNLPTMEQQGLSNTAGRLHAALPWKDGHGEWALNAPSSPGFHVPRNYGLDRNIRNAGSEFRIGGSAYTPALSNDTKQALLSHETAWNSLL